MKVLDYTKWRLTDEENEQCTFKGVWKDIFGGKKKDKRLAFWFEEAKEGEPTLAEMLRDQMWEGIKDDRNAELLKQRDEINSIVDEEIKAIKATYESLLKDAEDQLRKEKERSEYSKQEPEPRKFKEGEFYRVKYNGNWTIAQNIEMSAEVGVSEWLLIGHPHTQDLKESETFIVGKRIKFKD